MNVKANNQSNTRFLDLNTVKVIAHEISRSDHLVEAVLPVDNGFGIVVDGTSVRIYETFGTVFLGFEGAYTSFAQIDTQYGTEDLLAKIITAAIDKIAAR